MPKKKNQNASFIKMLNLDEKEKRRTTSITVPFPLRCRTTSSEPDSLPASYSLQLKQLKAGFEMNLLSSPGFVLTPYLQLMLPPSGWKTGTDAKCFFPLPDMHI